MNSRAFVVVIDIPSIKRFVFGTDVLNEVRGASALLDWLNQEEMELSLRDHPGMVQAQVKPIYANGGSAQFLVQGCDDEAAIKAACTGLVRYIREQTGGEVRAVFGIAPYGNGVSYREATRKAHFQLRCQREFATCYHSTALMPAVMECQSASHLPAEHAPLVDGSAELLSEASYQKRHYGRDARERGPWAGWMRQLSETGPWPKPDHRHRLRCESLTRIGEYSSWRNYVGVVYADGNAMGQIVQAIDSPETSHQFSAIVDDSIRQACFTALGEICHKEVAQVRDDLEKQEEFRPLPADILLLGGDDLLVALPADRALDFTLMVTDMFERLTREKIAALQDAEVRQFFHSRLGENKGLTISCGVAIVKSNYPFYLALDLSEQLLKNAKKKAPQEDGADPDPTRIDFHIVAGANSHVLEQVRKDDYRVSTAEVRTLRPLSRDQLRKLRASVQELRIAGFPRSKLHELQEGALDRRARQAGWRIKDIFGRSRHAPERSERLALWQAIHSLKPHGFTFSFPWFVAKDQRLLCVADLMEAYELFPPQ